MPSIRTLTVVGAIACSAAVASCAQPGEGAKRLEPKTHTVIMEGMVFRPDVITVATGDTIVWVNKDLVPHTATSEKGGFDSQVIQAGKSWTFTPRKKGKFAYICTYHPEMKAMLYVK